MPLRLGISISASDGKGVGLSPANLFAAGEQGLWLDPSDMRTMYQDSAATTPVTAAGQSVGHIRDKSGRGNHISFLDAARPVLRQNANGFWYLEGHASVGPGQSAAVDFSASDETFVCIGLTKLSDEAAAFILGLGNFATVAGTWDSYAPSSNGVSNVRFGNRGTALNNVALATQAAPFTGVMSATGKIATDVQNVRLNGAQAASSAADQGAGNMSASSVFNLFSTSAGGARFQGYFFGAVVRSGIPTAAQIAATERYMGQKLGVSI